MMEFKLKETRAEYNITQKELSDITEIPLRTIENWESGTRVPSPWVQKLVIEHLKHLPHNDYGLITEKKGFYTVEQIKELLYPLIVRFDIDKIILFGSYSKGLQDSVSDIDLVVDGNLKGIVFFELLEEVSNLFLKEVDLIHLSQIKEDSEMYNEVMQGMVLYERKR